MAETLATKMKLVLEAVLTNTLTGGESCSVTHGESISHTLTSGTTADKADKAWASEGRALTSGNSENIDLYDFGSLDLGAGAGKSALGQSMALAELVILVIRNRSTSVGTLEVGALAATTAFNSIFAGSDTDDAGLKLPPGAWVALCCTAAAAWAIADSTNHLLKILASGGNVTYDIWLVGRTA